PVRAAAVGGQEDAWWRQVLQEPKYAGWFDHILASAEIHFQPMRFPGEDYHTLVFVAPLISKAGVHHGFILAQADLGVLISSGFHDSAPPCCFRLSARGATLYEV